MSHVQWLFVAWSQALVVELPNEVAVCARFFERGEQHGMYVRVFHCNASEASTHPPLSL
jgi:hypothetical protein